MNGETKIWFSHGLHSGPVGTKIDIMTRIASELGYPTESVDYRGVDEPAQRVMHLQNILAEQTTPMILVGSSLGAHVATTVSRNVDCRGLFLLAPAFFVAGYEDKTPEPAQCHIEVVHGWHDDIIPVENGIRWARQHNAILHLVDDGHRLDHDLDMLATLFAAYLPRTEAR